MLINDYAISNNLGLDSVQDSNVDVLNPNNNNIDNEKDQRDRKKSKEWGKSLTEATLLKRFQGNKSIDDVQNDLHQI